MATSFRRNDAGITQLLNDTPARAAISQAAKDVADEAHGIVHHDTGAAARSYHATPAEPGDAGAVATAYTDDPAGSIIEFGSEDTSPQRPLTRGAVRAGLKVKDRGKP